MRVIVADDEPNLLSSVGAFLKSESIDAVLSPDGAKAKTLLSEESFDAAVLDIRMPGLDGISLLRWIKDEGLSLPVIMMSAHGDVRDAVEAMRLGAFDYLVKPFDPDELAIRLKKAVRDRRLSADREVSKRPAQARVRMVGESAAVKEALRLVERAAPTPSTVLITGESGTGKEVAARLIHDRSGRQGAFVAVNLGAVPENLLESELFGYEKGAFTGAAERKLGLFELADGGTLFLDEIGEMPAHMQVKILRAIQERKVMRLGGSQGVPVDARIVAATNRDLESMVNAGTFREDLYYRVNVVRIHLPPLRERPGDAVALALHFVESLAPTLGRKGAKLGKDALTLISTYPFPGNVRELSNAVERALILADGDELQARDFQLGAGKRFPDSKPSAQTSGTESGALAFLTADGTPRSIAEMEKLVILAALERNEGKRESTATELGITRRTLLNKLNEYGYSD
jgi:two-component system response regulator AtoC